MQLTNALKSAILRHAHACYPAESCGLIVAGDYIACLNIACDDNHFCLDPKDFAKAESLGEICAIVHSHPEGGVLPSDLDKLQIELHGVPWVIVAFSQKEYADAPEFAVYEPCGYRPPLIGRSYIHGVQDCYTIVRDFYARELGIWLPDFARADAWWEDANHPPLYEQNFANAGFRQIAKDWQSLRYGDVLLCQVGRTKHVNHALIWLGDNSQLISERTPPCIGNDLVLHHPYARQSVREIFGANWASRVALVVRYKQTYRG